MHVRWSRYRLANIPSLQCVANPDQGQLIRPDTLSAFAFTDFCGVGGSDSDNGIFRLDLSRATRKGLRFSQITGGLSNCLIFGERPPSDLDEGFGPWIGGQMTFSASTYINGTPINFLASLLNTCGGRTDLGFQNGERGSRCDWTHHWSFHPGGANFAKADGALTFLAYPIDKQILSELASRD